MPNAIFEHVRDLAMTLTADEQVALIGDLAAKLQGTFIQKEKKPFRSIRGILKDSGPAPSAQDIDEIRQEVWANFPREDIA